MVPRLRRNAVDIPHNNPLLSGLFYALFDCIFKVLERTASTLKGRLEQRDRKTQSFNQFA
jgi:hypothetical protein